MAGSSVWTPGERCDGWAASHGHLFTSFSSGPLAASRLAQAPLWRAQLLTCTAEARAQSGPPTVGPPPDATALVTAPKDSATAPDVKKPNDGTSVSLSAGGQLATGNSRLLAGTINGQFDSRLGHNGVGAAILANYGQGAQPGNAIVETAENIQGRVRYDRYVIDQASIFLINTGRHDRLQGLAFRYNLDPGLKYLFLAAERTTLWVEAGYDFQYDVREDDARVQLDASNVRIPGAPLLDKTSVNHSLRLFAGFKHAFNDEVTLATGLEYIQGISDDSHHWLNYDALFAAKIGGGLALGLGLSVRYDSDPLPGKKNLDTASTESLIYAFNDATPPADAASRVRARAPAAVPRRSPTPAHRAPPPASARRPCPSRRPRRSLRRQRHRRPRRPAHRRPDLLYALIFLRMRAVAATFQATNPRNITESTIDPARIDRVLAVDQKPRALGHVLVSRLLDRGSQAAMARTGRVESHEAAGKAARRLPPPALLSGRHTDLDPHVERLRSPDDRERTKRILDERPLVTDAAGRAEHRLRPERVDSRSRRATLLADASRRQRSRGSGRRGRRRARTRPRGGGRKSPGARPRLPAPGRAP